MEQSSRFLSLSGLSGITAGFLALIGLWSAYGFLNQSWFRPVDFRVFYQSDVWLTETMKFFIVESLVVLVMAFTFGLFFTVRKARKRRQVLWYRTSRLFVFDFLTPLFAGGIVCIALAYYGQVNLVPSMMLIFFALGLISAGKYAFYETRIFGFAQLLVGVLALFLPGWSLLFWGLGFGILNLAYGIFMFFKYDRKTE